MIKEDHLRVKIDINAQLYLVGSFENGFVTAQL